VLARKAQKKGQPLPAEVPRARPQPVNATEDL
jgi:hypothetical protein